jgi:hypothetical protein
MDRGKEGNEKGVSVSWYIACRRRSWAMTVLQAATRAMWWGNKIVCMYVFTVINMWYSKRYRKHLPALQRADLRASLKETLHHFPGIGGDAHIVCCWASSMANKFEVVALEREEETAILAPV